MFLADDSGSRGGGGGGDCSDCGGKQRIFFHTKTDINEL